jgi:hypothetical protein
MTPYQLTLVINDFAEKQKQESEERLTLAYMTAYWQRIKRMPSLDSIIKKEVEQKPETMLEEIMKLNTMFGGGTY